MTTVPAPKELPDELTLLFSDMNGVPRGKTIAGATFNTQAPPHLAEAVLFQTLTGAYADVVTTYVPDDRDLLLIPDWSTLRPTPWKSGSTGQVICETRDHAGANVSFDPRQVLRRVLQAYVDRDLAPVVAPEIEFYLLDPVGRDDLALRPASGSGGAAEFGGDAFNPDALDKFDDLLEMIRERAGAIGLPIAALVHEMGPAQIELNVAHGAALERADALFLLKRLIKGCAGRQNLQASFMAKPLAGLPGSGMHTHVSLLNGSGDNVFRLHRGQAPHALQAFIAGLQTYLPAAFPLLAPNVNSYKRFVRHSSAPINLEWGYDNRTTGLRIPLGPDAAGRVENRIAGADANPYLLVAATLACGLLGLQAELTPTSPVAGDAYDLPPAVPDNLEAALHRLRATPELVDLLGREFVAVYSAVKESELDEYKGQVSPWEVAHLGSQL